MSPKIYHNTLEISDEDFPEKYDTLCDMLRGEYTADNLDKLTILITNNINFAEIGDLDILCPNLKELEIDNRADHISCSKLDVLPQNLKHIFLYGTHITDIDLSIYDKLQKIRINYCEKLTNIILPTNIKKLFLMNNKIKSIDLTNCTKLLEVNIQNNELININLNCPKLILLNLKNNKLTNIDLESCARLEKLNLSNNAFTDIAQLHKLFDIKTLTEFVIDANKVRIPLDDIIYAGIFPKLQCLYFDNNGRTVSIEIDDTDIKYASAYADIETDSEHSAADSAKSSDIFNDINDIFNDSDDSADDKSDNDLDVD
jgi:Leucine-rich repeat (LRR) protein